MKDFIGLCGHTVLFKPELYSTTTRLVRDYHPVEWDVGSEAKEKPPFPLANNRVNWESVYGSWNKSGLDVNACLMFESVKEPFWKNRSAFAGEYAGMFAEQFGPDSARKLVNTVEIGNEPGELSDSVYQDLFVAVARGIRQKSPHMKIATCATVDGPSHRYAKSLDLFKGHTDLFDIITLHTYAQIENWPTWRRSFPEDSKLKNYVQDVQKAIDWRNHYAKDKEVWITEFGYDSSTKKPAPGNEFAKWEGVTDEQQAQWIVRSLLLFSSMDVSRAYIYFFNDDDTPQLHGSSGLTRQFNPKPSFYAVAHLQNLLGEYRFSKIILQEKEGGWIFEYTGKEKDAETVVWVAWLANGSQETKKITARLVTPSRNLLRVEKMPLSKTPATPPTLTAQNGALTELSVDASPIYLIFKK